jgi:hypothetical protein
MKRRIFMSVLCWLTVGLAACSKDDPQASLEAAVQQLQDQIEARDTGAVMDLLDARFRAQDEYDADWARKTMTLMFLRYAQVKVIALSRNSRIDPPGSPIGLTEAQVVVTGAQGLIPERVTPYAVTLEWRREGSVWRLRDLRWA